MNGVASNGMGPSSVGVRRYERVAVPLLLSLAACSAWAWEEVPPTPLPSSASATADQPMPPARLEISASTLPRFDNVDGTTRASRIDLTWLPPRQPGLGLAMGMSLGMTNRTAPEFSTGLAYLSASPGIDLGFHWRYTMNSQYRIDVAAWRRMAVADAIDLVQSREPAYGARVEMGLGSMPKTGFVADRGFLGVQLNGGARITVRRSAGKPMLYYRSNF
jgi:hypothetical protein